MNLNDHNYFSHIQVGSLSTYKLGHFILGDQALIPFEEAFNELQYSIKISFNGAASTGHNAVIIYTKVKSSRNKRVKNVSTVDGVFSYKEASRILKLKDL